MKEVNNDEFENLILEMVEGKKQIKDAITELESGYRTFHRKVMDLSITNPELYRKYVIKFPYKPKQITHIDYEALLIHVMKQDLTLEQAQEKFEISRRTIDRNIPKANISPDIVSLYRIYAQGRRGPSKLPKSVERRIEELEEREVVIDEVVGNRKRTLTLMKEKLEEKDGVSYAEKARCMGTTYRGNRNRVHELARIMKEKEIQEKEREDK